MISTEKASLAAQESSRDLGRFMRRVLRQPLGIAAAVLLLLLLALITFGPAFLEHSPTRTNPLATLQPPSASHWLGTDELGRDVFARIVHGGRVSLSVGLFSMLVGLTIRSEEHTSELQSRGHLVCRLLLEKKKKDDNFADPTYIVASTLEFLTKIIRRERPNALLASLGRKTGLTVAISLEITSMRTECRG